MNRKNAALVFVLTISTLSLFSQGTFSHHANTNYDESNKVSIAGTIVKYEWHNPHVYLYIEETLETGEKITWSVEGQPPSILRRMGWTKKTVQVGDKIKVNGSPGKNPKRKTLLLETLEKPDESILDIQFPSIIASLSQGDAINKKEVDGFNGTWVTKLDMQLMMKFMNPATLPLSEKGRVAQESFVETRDSPIINCIANPPPMQMWISDIKFIEVNENTVIIRGEFDASERTIYLNEKSHDNAKPSNLGHSIGHFDKDTLVIDTTHFTPHRSGNAGGVTSGSQKVLRERLTLDKENSRLLYSFEVEDPEYLDSPLAGENVEWAYRPDLEYDALPCNLENARRFTED